ncbi:copper resistance protein CopD [Peribacillus simplex]|uniref:Copper resistance protein CopD n=1 Tax=Peribacillus simplex TaxID=1478 RepID=A0A8B5XQS4_9BACI|nr:CopD family protein [Peribacillus simplex]TVX77177.1 copper resistance protein CopD [Peribacillus simplex]
MIVLGTISEALLYLCFSLLTGSFLLYLVPSHYRPEINVPKGALMLATGGIAILSFVPILQLILHLYHDIGLGQTLQSVLFTFEVGKAWIFTYILSNILFVFIVWFDFRKKLYTFIGIIFIFILMLALGWASHASSLDQWRGFLVHTIHFAAVTLWVGILFVVSWFSKNQTNWLNFLKWFTPVAISCFLITAVTGLILMSFVIDFSDYANAWMLPYGQALLLKHLLIIPLLSYAFINSILIRIRIKRNNNFNPIPWTKVESLIVFLIFSATAVLGQQSPPHDIETSLASGPSKLFALLYQGNITREMNMVISFGLNSYILLILGILFVIFTVLSFIKKAPPLFSFIMGVLCVLSFYLTLMLSIQ